MCRRTIQTLPKTNERIDNFSIVDVCEVLTNSKDSQAYWRKLKQRLKDEGNETVTNCHALKMKAAQLVTKNYNI